MFLSIGLGFRGDSKTEHDYTLQIPDELVSTFQSPWLRVADKKSISLVCRRWYKAEGWSRQFLCVWAKEDLICHLLFLLSRFDSVTKLALVCRPEMISMDNKALVMISTQCGKLTSLALGHCLRITNDGMAVFAKNCQILKMLKIWCCKLGAAAFNSVLSHCSLLEDLIVASICDTKEIEFIGTGMAASSLKSISLSVLYNGVGECFAPLIVDSKELKTLHFQVHS